MVFFGNADRIKIGELLRSSRLRSTVFGCSPPLRPEYCG